MNKVMRQKLKDKGLSVPRANKDAQRLYEKTFASEYIAEAPTDSPISPVVEKPELTLHQNIWTYIGKGDEPPHMINFMGMQKFIRGAATEVSNPLVIAKLKTNPCFVEGEYDSDLMFENDVLEKKKADAQRARDLVTNQKALRKRA